MLTNAAPSPFIPATQIQFAWDSTSLGYFKTCPRLYYYIMLEGWGSEAESIHLRFGTEFHSAMQDYAIARAEGESHQNSVIEVVRALLERTFGWEVDEGTKAGKYKNRRTLLRSVIDYLDEHEHDPAKTYILADGRPAVELSFRFELDFGPTQDQPYLLCGHLDRVVNLHDDLYVKDYKTTTTTPSPYYFQQYSPSNQMTLYALASQIILGSPIKGVIIDAVQLLVDSTRSVRGITYRSEDQLQEWLRDLQYHLSTARYYAEENYWPQNDTACDKFGGCRFREVCSRSPSVREQFLKTDFVKLPLEERWNPLKPR